ncbi:unnamed protein product [Anisakis simplex]|uniref:Uncharacterized protein n=1 Tax=Anisakis simplex TaxID=6269 RepID=A0A3P6PFP2_ANISI|nr:unnamed protein product [Anisakis simplex]
MDVLADKELDISEFEAAKRSLVCDLMESLETVKRAADQTLLAQFRQIPADYTRELCEQIWSASVEEVLEKGSAPLRNLFDDAKCTRSICVHPSKVDDVKGHFPNIQCVPIEQLAIDPSLKQF